MTGPATSGSAWGQALTVPPATCVQADPPRDCGSRPPPGWHHARQSPPSARPWVSPDRVTTFGRTASGPSQALTRAPWPRMRCARSSRTADGCQHLAVVAQCIIPTCRRLGRVSFAGRHSDGKRVADGPVASPTCHGPGT